MKFLNFKKIDLIYIVGNGRSGSTLLSRILNNHNKLASLGELHYFDICRELKNKNKILSLIAKLYLKKLKINKRSLKNVNEIKVCRYPSLKEFLTIFDLSKPNKMKSIKDTHNFYKDNYLMFKSIKEITKKKIIVDSSKTISRLYHLNKSGLFNIKIIYLHRISRAFVNSGKKKGLSAFQSSLHWNIRNRRAQIFLKKNKLSYYDIRYEDLINNTEHTLSKLFNEFLNIKLNRNIIYFSKKTDLVGGNPDVRGKIKIYKKEEWKQTLSFFQILIDKIINDRMNKILRHI
jgi:hypothetical protein